MTASLGLC